MIQLKNLSFAYPNGKEILKNIQLEIKAGECVVLCGESGCGKSTLLRVLDGLIPELYEGTLAGEGHVLGTSLPAEDFNQYVKEMGVVFQNPKTQFFTNDVYSELAFAMENYGVSPTEMKERVAEVTKEFDLSTFLEKSMFHLSGGEKQRIAFASSMMMPHELFLLDEPSSNLDLETIRRLKEYLLKVKETGMTLVISEHRLYYLADVADRFVLMKEGAIVGDYTREEMLNKSSEELNELGLRELRLSPLKIKEEQYPLSRDRATLVCQNLHFHYKKQQEVLAVPALTLRNHEVTGIVGHNGAGKSTFTKVISGLEKASGGEVLYNGVAMKPRDLIKESFVVMQDVNLQLFCETVEKEITLKAQKTAEFSKVVTMLNLNDLLKRHPQTLSGGEKQRVAIASSLLSGKRVIIFDEPTSGLDLKHMQEVSDTIAWLKESEAVVLIVSHDQEFLRCTCERLLEFEKGKLVKDAFLEIERIAR